MKKILFLLLLISGVAYGQKPIGFTQINSRYEYLAIGSDSGILVPRYATVPSGVRGGMPNWAGQIGVDTTNHRFYFYSGGSWRYSTASTSGGGSIAGSGATNRVAYWTSATDIAAVPINATTTKKVLTQTSSGVPTFDTLGTLSGVYSAEDFGLVADSVTDNGPALNAAIAAAPEGSTIYFRGIKPYLINTQVVVNKRLKFLGAGSTNGYAYILGQSNTAPTRIITTSGTLVMILVHASNVTFDGISFENKCVTVPTAGAGIQIGDAANIQPLGFRLNNCAVLRFYDNILARYAMSWGMDNLTNANAVHYGLWTESISLPDGGDNYISNSNFYGGIDTAEAMIYQRSGGGLKVSNTKFNTCCAPPRYMYHAQQMNTIDIQFSNCSVENYFNYGFRIDSTTASFANFLVSNCQFSAFLGWPNVVADISVVGNGTVKNISITGCVFSTGNNAQYAVYIDSIARATVLNTYDGYSTPVFIGPTTTLIADYNSLGVGKSDFRWNTGDGLWDVGKTSILHGTNPSYSMDLLSNVYYSTGFKYKATNTASKLTINKGDIGISSAVSGAADAAITFFQPFKVGTVAGAGYVGIGGDITLNDGDFSGAKVTVSPTLINSSIPFTTTDKITAKDLNILQTGDVQNSIWIKNSSSQFIFQAGNYPSANTYYSAWYGNVTPSGTNYSILGDGADNVFGATNSFSVRINNVSTPNILTAFAASVTVGGHLLSTDNTYDIGASGATRFRTAYLGTSLISPIVNVTGRLLKTQGADIASVAGAIALGADGNSFEITGTNAITLISNLSWQNGSEVTLLFTSTATLTDGTANSGTDIGMELAGNANFVASAGATVKLLLSEIGGTQRWRETGRSVN